jgi:L-ascorbate metabolism protein UlaG (beta-lactamase superfamily)
MRARFLAFALLLTLLTASTARAASTQITWYGHAAFKITTPSGHVLLLDPWITNPANKNGAADLAGITKADYILITHGHFDHVGDSVALANKTGAHLVATGDLGDALVAYAGYPKELAGMDTQGNFGGELSLLGGEVKVLFVPAIHSSAISPPPGSANMDPHNAGNPGGFVITIAGGPTIYDTGDTDEFADMALIPKAHKIDVMLCCIGDHYTMGPERAADAVQMVGPRIVVPMHYGTFPILTGTPAAFGAALKKNGAKAHMTVMRVDQTLTF